MRKRKVQPTIRTIADRLSSRDARRPPLLLAAALALLAALLPLLASPGARAQTAAATPAPEAVAASAPETAAVPATASATNVAAATTASAAEAGAAPAAQASDAAPVPAATPADGSSASSEATPADTRGIDEETQQLKKDAIDLNRELFMLEEELLFPANTQVAVFVSMDVGEFFALDSLQLRVDDREVANYLYTEREAEALLKGGVHRVYLGNLKVGEHELVAIFTGKGPNQRDYRRGATLKFDKAVGAKYLELKITDRQRRAQPEFEIKDWE
jgi:hypothetical protein